MSSMIVLPPNDRMPQLFNFIKAIAANEKTISDDPDGKPFEGRSSILRRILRSLSKLLRNAKRRDLHEAQDPIGKHGDEMIRRIESRLKRRHTVSPLFTLRWVVC
jgi:hypothetical protein